MSALPNLFDLCEEEHISFDGEFLTVWHFVAHDEPNSKKRESLLPETSKKNMGRHWATFLLILFSVFISLPDAVAATYSLPF
jgi:hypothetical protein